MSDLPIVLNICIQLCLTNITLVEIWNAYDIFPVFWIGVTNQPGVFETVLVLAPKVPHGILGHWRAQNLVGKIKNKLLNSAHLLSVFSLEFGSTWEDAVFKNELRIYQKE